MSSQDPSGATGIFIFSLIDFNNMPFLGDITPSHTLGASVILYYNNVAIPAGTSLTPGSDGTLEISFRRLVPSPFDITLTQANNNAYRFITNVPFIL
jgi:hypothetical protein